VSCRQGAAGKGGPRAYLGSFRADDFGFVEDAGGLGFAHVALFQELCGFSIISFKWFAGRIGDGAKSDLTVGNEFHGQRKGGARERPPKKRANDQGYGLVAKVPVVSICAVRTGAGKSQTTRRVRHILAEKGKRVVVVRHPMPYGDLVKQRVQRFSTLQDLDRHECTIEEREEYEPHLVEGAVVYAGVDYQEILKQAESECDVLLWDGGNNDLPFYQPTIEIVVTDPHRAGHELTYHPGEANLLRAQVVIINKIDSADKDAIQLLRKNIATLNPKAMVIEAASPLFVEDGEKIRGKRVLAIEDGPTITHGGMAFGAATLAARRLGAAELVDPRPHAVGSLRDTFRKYPHLGSALPAMGYGEGQVRDLEATINACDAEIVVFATPVDLRHLVRISQPALRVRYEIQEIGKPDLEDALASL